MFYIILFAGVLLLMLAVAGFFSRSGSSPGSLLGATNCSIRREAIDTDSDKKTGHLTLLTSGCSSGLKLGGCQGAVLVEDSHSDPIKLELIGDPKNHGHVSYDDEFYIRAESGCKGKLAYQYPDGQVLMPGGAFPSTHAKFRLKSLQGGSVVHYNDVFKIQVKNDITGSWKDIKVDNGAMVTYKSGYTSFTFI